MTNEKFKKTLWDTANKLRGSVSASDYKHPVPGLVFLKYVSDMRREKVATAAISAGSQTRFSVYFDEDHRTGTPS